MLTDLSKSFDYIPCDFLIKKLAAHGFSEKVLMYILCNLSNLNQFVRINNTYSDFERLITDVPQGSILDSILFNLSINVLFFFILIDHYIIFQMTTRCRLLLKMSQSLSIFCTVSMR